MQTYTNDFFKLKCQISSAPKGYLKKIFVQTYAKLYNLRKFINLKRRGAKYFNPVYTVHFYVQKNRKIEIPKKCIKKYLRRVDQNPPQN